MPVPPIRAAATSIGAFVGAATSGPVDTPVALTSVAEFAQVFGAGPSPLSLSVSQFFANGGEQAWVVRAGSGSGDDEISEPGLEARRRGLWAMSAVDPFNLLCIPPLAFGPASDVSARTRRAAAELCRARHAIYLVDPLASWAGAGDVLAGMQSAEWGLPPHPNVALYWPFPIAVAAGSGVACGPSGAVAGIIARTDATRGVWKAPAGADAAVAGVSGLASSVTAAEQARLNQAGVNVLRTFPGAGTVVWGARTLMGDDTLASEWKYLPVRRLGLMLETSFARSEAWTATQPNGEPLWKDLRLASSAFLHDLFVAGAFHGRTDREAWFVKCDAATTTASEIAAGRVRLLIGFAPLRPSEFIVLELALKAAAPGENG